MWTSVLWMIFYRLLMAEVFFFDFILFSYLHISPLYHVPFCVSAPSCLLFHADGITWFISVVYYDSYIHLDLFYHKTLFWLLSVWYESLTVLCCNLLGYLLVIFHVNILLAYALWPS